jgi:hypothetical protein
LVILGIAIFVVGIGINGYNFYRNYYAEQEQFYFQEACAYVEEYNHGINPTENNPWHNARMLIRADIAYHNAIAYGADPDDELHRYIHSNLKGYQKLIEQKTKGLKLSDKTKDAFEQIIEMMPQ